MNKFLQSEFAPLSQRWLGILRTVYIYNYVHLC